jgi:prepilin-type N-terminal cleavage/methylation domain-containing protein
MERMIMKIKPCDLKSKSGFTLIEMVYTVLVFSILAAIAIPGFSRWLPGYHLRTAARDVVSNLQMARLEAVKRNQNSTFTINSAGSSYTIDFPNRSVNLKNDYSNDISMDAATTSTSVIFSSGGLAARTGYTDASGNGCITLKSDKTTLTLQITISGVGNIKLRSL